LLWGFDIFRMMKKSLLFVLAILLSLGAVTAQEKGFVRGNIVDGDFGGPMVGATIFVADNLNLGTTSDFDGNYSLSLDPGSYTIKMSFISFVTLTFEDVEVKEGETTAIDAIMNTVSEELDEVEVVARAKRDSEIGMLTKMKSAVNVVDGLSAQSFRKIGDGDLSAAIKRVTGVTVEGGKYVYVRGLGDRYSKTTLNGMAIPGLDPDVNAVQIDIFPTAVLENVAVYKTFTPDLYGDFTGGLVDIETKSFPDSKITSFSLGIEYVQGQTYNSDYILYEGGKWDMLGFDDGTRKLPISKTEEIPLEVVAAFDQVEGAKLERITRSFNPNLAVRSKNAIPNGSFSFNHGNQIQNEKGANYGYNFVLNYNSSNFFYDNFESNIFLKNTNAEINEMEQDENRNGIVGGRTAQWSAMATGSYKKNTNTINLMLLMNQGNESTASKRVSQNFNQTQATLLEDILTYTQRSLATAYLNGNHMLGKTQLQWANALSLSRVYDPDFRTTALSIKDQDTTLSTGDGANISRFWRDLNETNENFKLDLKRSLGSKIELKAGANLLLKWRDFETFSYAHDRRNKSNISGNPDWFLSSDNIWTIEDRNGTYTTGNFEPANNYNARQNIYGMYLMAEQMIGLKIKLIYGLRIEKGEMYYTGESNSGIVKYDNEKTLDELDLLPSLNLVYSLTEDMNLRLTGTRTIARPSFKEKSISQIYDPITKRTFVGNIDLNQTSILNFDLRYEWFMSPKELLSLAAFYKIFDGHIELVSFEQDPDNVKPRNSGDASVAGIEFEIRKGFNNSGNAFLRRLFLGGNVTFVQSQVDMTKVKTGNEGQTEFDLRERNARAGETVDQFRNMAGQSPYTVNANISYEIPEKKIAFSLAYNVKGDQLSIIGSGRTPDVHTLPFHSLNFNSYFSFGEELNHRITIGVSNILDQSRQMVYQSFQATDEIFNIFKPGRAFSIKYSFTF
jgi:TonB-dependent receptor